MSATSTATAPLKTHVVGRTRTGSVADQAPASTPAAPDLPGHLEGDLSVLERGYLDALKNTGVKQAEAAAMAEPPKPPTAHSPVVYYLRRGKKVDRVEASILRLHPPAEANGPALADLAFFDEAGEPKTAAKVRHDPGFEGCFGLVGEPPRRLPTPLEILDREQKAGNPDAPRIGQHVHLFRPNRFKSRLLPLDCRITAAHSMTSVDVFIFGTGHLRSPGDGVEVKSVTRGTHENGWMQTGRVNPAGISIGEAVPNQCCECGQAIVGRGIAVKLDDGSVPLLPNQIMFMSPTAMICEGCRIPFLIRLGSMPEPPTGV